MKENEDLGHQPQDCQVEANIQCPKYPQLALEKGCFDFMDVNRMRLDQNNDNMTSHLLSNVPYENAEHADLMLKSPAYTECIGRYQEMSRQCIHKLYRPCNDAKIKAAKLVRARNESNG